MKALKGAQSEVREGERGERESESREAKENKDRVRERGREREW